MTIKSNRSISRQMRMAAAGREPDVGEFSVAGVELSVLVRAAGPRLAGATMDVLVQNAGPRIAGVGLDVLIQS